VLVRIDELKVASRTSAFAFRGGSVGIPEIAGALGVRQVLEGSVRKEGERVRITAQLIDAGEDAHLWSETFDRDLNDIFAIQDEIARTVHQALLATFEGSDKPRPGTLVEAPTENLDAYDLYLEGLDQTLDTDRRIAALKQATDIDPAFARAWEQLARVYFSAQVDDAGLLEQL